MEDAAALGERIVDAGTGEIMDSVPAEQPKPSTNGGKRASKPVPASAPATKEEDDFPDSYISTDDEEAPF